MLCVSALGFCGEMNLWVLSFRAKQEQRDNRRKEEEEGIDLCEEKAGKHRKKKTAEH